MKCELAACLVQAQERLRARVRVKTLAMWTDQGRLGQELCKVNPLLLSCGDSSDTSGAQSLEGHACIHDRHLFRLYMWVMLTCPGVI